MCYLCNCLAWSMDVMQRAITFCITSILMFIICLGFSICIIAGIAYGYNYSLAEFITFTRSDVSVYMRRGQWNDRKDLAEFGPLSRRVSDEDDSFSNISTDYQDTMVSAGDKKPLSETLVKSQDTRKYAERLSKFSNTLTSKRFNEEDLDVPEGSVSYYRFTTPPVHHISINPNPAIQTTVVQSGSSAIVMRKFPPLKDISSDIAKKDPDEYFYRVNDLDERDKIKSKMKINRGESSEEISDDNEKLHEVSTSHSIPMRHFEGGVPDVDEENMAYKPV
ncbi:uncharacterized protein [Battus philenor]|uniref:uncharacterized protein n=1 Tax=Battus philenor TaxID=42288 RepID=UPI0035CEC304